MPFTLNLPFLSSQGESSSSSSSPVVVPQNDASLSLNLLQTVDLIQSARELVREYTPGNFFFPQPFPNDTVPEYYYYYYSDGRTRRREICSDVNGWDDNTFDECECNCLRRVSYNNNKKYANIIVDNIRTNMIVLFIYTIN
jgi:hypothetical protein